jgi:hypothetical protein
MIDRPVADRELRSLPVSFHPDSMMIESNRKGQQILGWLKDSKPSSSSRPIQVSKSKAIFLGQVLHERDHLRRHLGTTYGILMHTIRLRFIEAFVGAFDDAVERGATDSELSMLIPDSALTNPDSLSALKQKLLSATYALLAMEGELGEQSFRVSQSVLEDALREHGIAITDFRPLPPSRDFTGSGQPLTVNGKTHVLSGKHVLEMFAVCEETDQLISVLPSLDRIWSLLSSLEYSFVLRAWHTLFDARSLPEPLEQSGAREKYKMLGYRLFPLELFAAADLALWPAIRSANASPSASSPWADVHPGSRFLAALRVLKDQEIVGMAIPGSGHERKDAFASIQGMICKELGWRTPEQLTADWVDAFRREPTASPCSTWQSACSEITMSRRQLFGIRREFGCDAALNALDWAALGAPSEYGMIVDDDDDAFRRRLLLGRQEGKEEPSLLCFYAFNAARQLCFDEPECRLLMAFDEDERRAAALGLSDVYASNSGRHTLRLEKILNASLKLKWGENTVRE